MPQRQDGYAPTSGRLCPNVRTVMPQRQDGYAPTSGRLCPNVRTVMPQRQDGYAPARDDVGQGWASVEKVRWRGGWGAMRFSVDGAHGQGLWAAPYIRDPHRPPPPALGSPPPVRTRYAWPPRAPLGERFSGAADVAESGNECPFGAQPPGEVAPAPTALFWWQGTSGDRAGPARWERPRALPSPSTAWLPPASYRRSWARPSHSGAALARLVPCALVRSSGRGGGTWFGEGARATVRARCKVWVYLGGPSR